MNGSKKYGALVVVCLTHAACATPGNGNPPALHGVEPYLVCAYQPTHFEVTGSNFAPAVTNDNTGSPSLVLPTVSLQGPSSAPVSTTSWQDASDISFMAGPGPGQWQVQVTNPSGAQTASLPVLSLSAPLVTPLDGNSVCSSAAQPHVAVLQGSNMLQVDGLLPTVYVANQAVAVSVAPGDCTSQGSPFGNVQICNSLRLNLPTSVPAGGQSVSVVNPGPLNACPGTATRLLAVPGITPILTAPATMAVCSGGGPLQLQGSNLSPAATVRIGDVVATYNTSSACDPNSGLCQEITANFGAISDSGSGLNLSVTNPGNCVAQQAATLSLIQGPQLMAVDPPVIYDGISNALTLYMHDWNDSLTGLSLLSSNGASLAICGNGAAACSAVITPGGASGDVAITLTLPANLLAQVGSGGLPYATADIVLQTARTCGAYLPHGLQIVGMPADVDMGLTPNIAVAGGNTLVSVALTGAPSAGLGAGARVYLVGSSHSAPLQNIAWINSTTLQGTLPEGLLASGLFEDMHAVVVDGPAVAWRSNQTLRLTNQPNFSITAVSSASLAATTNTLIQVSGTNFDLAMQAQWVGCIDAHGTQVQPTAPALSELTPQSVQLTAAPLSSSLPPPVACSLQLTSGVDGQVAVLPGMVFLNGSGALAPTRDTGVGLVTPRQGLGAAVVHLTPNQGFLYAAGGTASSALATVELAPLDPNGGLAAGFAPNRSKLQTPRSQFGLLAVGRALYAVGGTNDVSPALNSIERAEVLDPNEAPPSATISGFSYSAGNPAGNYLYSVAALYAAADPYNPCGESLPSLATSVNVLTSGMSFSLGWNPPTGSANRSILGYRVYRSTPNGGLGSLTYLTDVATAQLTDQANLTPATLACQGASAPAATTPPLPLGTTSQWVTLEQQLVNGRSGAGYASVIGPGVAYLYALAGVDAKGVRQDYEAMSLDLAAGSHAAAWEAGQTVTAVNLPLTACGGQPRAYAGLFVLNAANASPDGITNRIAGITQYLVLGPGIGSAGTAVAAVDAWVVASNGSLGSSTVGSACLDSRGQISHYGSTAINGGLAFLGGQERPSSVGRVGWSYSGNTITFDSTFSDNVTLLAQPRSGAACLKSGAFIFAVGGFNSTTTSLTGGVEYGTW